MASHGARSRKSVGVQLGSVALRYRPRQTASWPPVCAPKRQLTACRGNVESVIVGGSVRSEKIAWLEAVLFLAREPLTSRKLAQLTGLADGTEARTLVRALNRLYDAEGRAFRAVEVAGGFQLMSRPQFAPWLRRLHSAPVEVRLSAPAMETLAVIAYRQPVLRAAIEAIRGVQCGEILRQLMERDLVKIAGRSDELGRPFLYGTTRRFLRVFGLRGLDELPRHEWFAPRDDEHPTPLSSHGDPNADMPPSDATDAETQASHPNRFQDGSDQETVEQPFRSSHTVEE